MFENIKYVCIKDNYIKVVYPYEKTVNFIKYEIYFACENIAIGYSIYDDKMNFLTCILGEEHKENFLEFSEFRDKQIRDILND